MKSLAALEHKIVAADWTQNPHQLLDLIDSLPTPRVFTNGCFDILHRGHITYLAQAADLGASLIVGVNDDASVKAQNKGAGRPINPLEDRQALLAALQSVSAVVPFADSTPLSLINLIKPEILVKGGDWEVDDIVGAAEVRGWGGGVYSIPFKVDRSTTRLLARIKSRIR